MVIRHLEITTMTVASLGFGKTLQSASYNIFHMSVLRSMYDPRSPTLAAVEEERKNLRNEEELNDMRDDTQKKEEHIYSVISPAEYNQAVTPTPLFKFVLILFLGRITLNFPHCDD